MSDSPNGSARFGKSMGPIAKWLFVVAFGMFSIVLLVAGKSIAGAALASSVLIMALPLNRLIKNKRHVLWTRVISVAVLLIVTIVSIAGTDILPEQRKTGYDFVDKVSAIFQEFQETVSGRNNSAEPGNAAKKITQETADKFAACMRQQGLADLPNPQLTEDGVSFDFSRMSASQETIRAAQDACQHVLREAE